MVKNFVNLNDIDSFLKIGIPFPDCGIEKFILSGKNNDADVVELERVLKNLSTLNNMKMKDITNAFSCADVACGTYHEIGYVFKKEKQLLLYYKSENSSVYAVVLDNNYYKPVLCHRVIN